MKTMMALILSRFSSSTKMAFFEVDATKALWNFESSGAFAAREIWLRIDMKGLLGVRSI